LLLFLFINLLFSHDWSSLSRGDLKDPSFVHRSSRHAHRQVIQ
jgi:hypothetical protein